MSIKPVWMASGCLVAALLTFPAVAQITLAGSAEAASATRTGAGLSAQRPASADTSDTVNYTIRRGDTLIGLAQHYFQRPGQYAVVQRLNRIADPCRLRAGQTIRVPVGLLRYRATEAQVISWRGDISITGGDGRQLAPAVQLGFGEGTAIATGQSSSLVMRLDDGSIVTIPSNSSVRLARLRHLQLTDSIDYEIAVDHGRMNSRVTPMRSSQGRFRNRTPVSTSAVRGTDFSTGYDQAQARGLTELAEGGVSVAAGTGNPATRLEPGFGAVAAASGLSVEPLLPAPTLVSGDQTQRQPVVLVEAAPQPSSRGYRLTVAKDSSFIDLVADQYSAEPHITLDALDDGRYFARVVAIAPSGLEGIARNFAFRRRLNSTTAAVNRADDGFKFAWHSSGNGKASHHFQLFRAEGEPGKARPAGVPLIDEPALSSMALTVAELPPGLYVWRVSTSLADGADTDTAWANFQDFTVGGE